MDARAMLRAQKATTKIQHPYASYSTSGQLKCSACAIPVPANKWDGHLLTKQHRTSVAREKAIQAKAEAKAQAKRTVDDGPSVSKRARMETTLPPAAVDIDEDEDEDGDGAGAGAGGSSGPSLPAGFFSSGNQPAITRSGAGDEEDDDDEYDDEIEGGSARLAQNIVGSTSDIPKPPSTVPQKPEPTGDDELDTFLASLAEPDDTSTTAGSSTMPIPATAATAATRRKPTTYKELIPGQASYEAAPIRLNPAGETQDAEEEEEEAVQETEAEKRERLKREEREEIMGRLEEEERAQEDADSRVAMLKQRMEMLKKRREAKSDQDSGVAGKALKIPVKKRTAVKAVPTA